MNCLVASLLAAAFLAPTALSSPSPLKVEDIFELQLAVDPQVSPDGKRVVYVRRFADITADQRRSNLWIVNVDGSGHRPLTTGNYSDESPRWSPDGSQVAFISDRDGKPQIWRLWLDNRQLAKVTNLTAPPSGIAWSPDGKRISYSSLVPEPPAKVPGMPSPPEGAKWADPAVIVDRLVYRFNGPGYLKPGFLHLFAVPADGGTPRQVTSGNFHHGSMGLLQSEGVWSADSKSLLISANRRADADLEPLDTEIYEFSLDGGQPKALTNRRGPDNTPAVSPDGNLIAYTGFDDAYQGYQVTRLYVMNRDGSGSRQLAGTLDRDIRGIRWAADSSGLYFTADDLGNTGLYFLPLSGNARKLTGNIGASFSAYGGGGSVTAGAGGVFATTWCRPDRPGDIAVGTLQSPTPKVITAVNEGLLSQRRLAGIEEIWYPSSKDGRKIHGWILKPPDFDPAKKYPLLLEIHGGPFANYGDRFDIEKQLMAASGRVVLYTNPRGSTSYGGEFGNLIHHAYPGDDFHDLNSGVDAMVAKGYIEQDNLFVTGGSGGGVLTCWMIGRTPRFRAAVTVYPVINWYSFNLTADIGAFTTKYWFPGLPWDHVEHYEQRSLLSVVKNVKTPTMVLTGEEDYRTPMSESEQYYQALKLLGVETTLVRVPGEPHGISRRPSHHVAKVLSILGWFDKHQRR
jgi:dipeptidyl aminopeptidase/acylaminoacyl peptidase